MSDDTPDLRVKYVEHILSEIVEAYAALIAGGHTIPQKDSRVDAAQIIAAADFADEKSGIVRVPKEATEWALSCGLGVIFRAGNMMNAEVINAVWREMVEAAQEAGGD